MRFRRSIPVAVRQPLPPEGEPVLIWCDTGSRGGAEYVLPADQRHRLMVADGAARLIIEAVLDGWPGYETGDEA